MPRRALAFVLWLILAVPYLYQIGTYGWFQLNRERIARTLCERRFTATGVTMCGGSCQLRKRLGYVRIDEENRNRPTTPPLPAFPEVLFTLDPLLFEFTGGSGMKSPAWGPGNGWVPHAAPYRKHFHPPDEDAPCG